MNGGRPVSARRATARDFNNLRAWREILRARQFCHVMRERVRCALGHLAAGVANQEGNGLVCVMAVPAGEERVAAFDAMNEAVLHEEIQRPIDRDRRGPATGLIGQQVDQLVSADRPVRAGERVQHTLPSRRHAAGFGRMVVRAMRRIRHGSNIGAGVVDAKVWRLYRRHLAP